MEKATSLGETEDPTTTNRWNEARHTDDRFAVRQVDDLEAMQSLERLDGGRALHPDARRQSDEVDFSPAGMLFHDSSEPASQKRRCRTDELRPHLLDVPIAQSPSIIGVGRDRNQVQNRLLRKAIHDPVKAPNQLIRDGETASALLDSRRSGRICRQRPSRASGRRPRSEAGPRVPALALRARPFASSARASAGSRTGLRPLRRRDYRALHKGRSAAASCSARTGLWARDMRGLWCAPCRIQSRSERHGVVNIEHGTVVGMRRRFSAGDRVVGHAFCAGSPVDLIADVTIKLSVRGGHAQDLPALR